jgi:hypothetical protein
MFKTQNEEKDSLTQSALKVMLLVHSSSTLDHKVVAKKYKEVFFWT